MKKLITILLVLTSSTTYAQIGTSDMSIIMGLTKTVSCDQINFDNKGWQEISKLMKTSNWWYHDDYYFTNQDDVLVGLEMFGCDTYDVQNIDGYIYLWVYFEIGAEELYYLPVSYYDNWVWSDDVLEYYETSIKNRHELITSN